ncbi:hypothetical protein B484DRAFT_83980 [Ochromonadaceae sp. CCMP2298]|nr:hypothetical protein B484DRAFT_83980 [Ochromonadaceae sp. CCMP2298]
MDAAVSFPLFLAWFLTLEVKILPQIAADLKRGRRGGDEGRRSVGGVGGAGVGGGSGGVESAPSSLPAPMPAPMPLPPPSPSFSFYFILPVINNRLGLSGRETGRGSGRDDRKGGEGDRDRDGAVVPTTAATGATASARSTPAHASARPAPASGGDPFANFKFGE